MYKLKSQIKKPLIQLWQTIEINLKNILFSDLEDSKVILDLGCGPDSYLKNLKNKHCIGIEIFKGSYLLAKKNKTHNEIHNDNILNFEKYIKNKNVDTAILIDVIEHLNKKDTIFLLNKLKSYNMKTIVYTPNGYLEQDAHSDNIHQKHISGYDYTFFKKRGFDKIQAIGYSKDFRTGVDLEDKDSFQCKLKSPYKYLAYLSQFIIEQLNLTNKSHSLYCVRYSK